MGLGKTVQGCALLKAYQDEWPALVVAPSSLKQTWADALRKVAAMMCSVAVYAVSGAIVLCWRMGGPDEILAV